MKVRFFSICYGDAYADLYERVLIRSLTQPRNREAIPKDAVVSLYGDHAMPRLIKSAEKLGWVVPHFVEFGEDPASALNDAIMTEMEICLAEGAAMIPAGPDAFWGDGSLANLLAIAGDRKVCIAAPHVRVDRDKFLAALPPPFPAAVPLTNASLVDLAMRTLHPAARDACADLDPNNSFNTALSIKSIAPGLWSVGCLLQTVWYARFEPCDLEFFRRARAVGMTRGVYDHIWPQGLVMTERHRSIGSSDGFFLAELTEADSHISPTRPRDPHCTDAYVRSAPHISANRNVQAIWRAA